MPPAGADIVVSVLELSEPPPGMSLGLGRGAAAAAACVEAFVRRAAGGDGARAVIW